ncbi:MAG TPA: hypothetical protein VLQ52_06040 [Coriobacteriia bacterium]|nr:hypothetical protein [Coriobacteriia bacterium]
MRQRVCWPIFLVGLVAVLFAATVLACGGDPYTGTWSGGADTGTFKIQKANAGWWSIEMVDAPTPLSYAAEIEGELQTANGVSAFKRSGDKLLFTVLDAPPVELTRQ